MSISDLQAYITENARSIRELKDSTKALRKLQKETDRQMKETDRQMKESSQDFDRRLREMGELFTGQWGKLVEALVQPGCLRLFRERGMAVERACTNQEWFRGNAKVAEVDVFLVNGGEDVAVEVKTTCRPKDIDDHVERMRRITALRSEYRDGVKKLYGAVAALKYVAEADAYAQGRGFYVLKSTGGIVSIGNGEGFVPRAY